MSQLWLTVFLLSACFNLFSAQDFGYPQQRGHRRYYQYGFNPNYQYQNQNPKVTIVEVQPYDSQSSFIYPSNNRQRPIYRYYDQYGRPVVNQNYPEHTTPQQWTWGNNQGSNPERGEITAYDNGNNDQHVKFPGDTNSNVPAPIYPSNANQDNFGGGEKEDNSQDSTKPTTLPEVPSELPPLTPVPEEIPTTLPPLKPVGIESEPVFTLPPLTPVPPSDVKTEGSAFDDITSTLPPLTPVPSSQSRSNVNFGSADTFSEPCEVDGVKGSCIPLSNCETYSKLLAQARSNPQVVGQLRRAHCGFDGSTPKVCCPAPGIPDKPPAETTTSVAAPLPIPSENPNTPNTDVTGDSDFVSELPKPPVCGRADPTFTKVVGGIDAKLGDLPWMALLGYKKRNNIAWQCGGSLVSSKHVITAAHCIYGLEKSLYVVRLGELDLASENDGANPIDILIKKMTSHQDYSRNTLTNDIGMLVLQREIQFTDQILPICIPATRELRANTFDKYNPFVAGWGALKYKGPSASILQVVQLPVVANDVCEQRYSAYRGQITIDDRVLCAGYDKGQKDACQGDSGGPLIQPIYDNEEYKIYYYQIGVVSFGKKCAEPGFPGIYTRMTTFVPWIEEHMLGPNARNL